MSGKLKITRGSGNVFLDVGFPPNEADNLMLRAQLMSRVRAAMRGKIGNFSLDALVNMLGHAGMRVELKVKTAA